jgi:hypothetical protein
MKKFSLVIALIILTSPAVATVTIIADCNYFGEPNECVIRYVADGNDVRAFALDVTVDSGANIVSVDDISEDYYVHPGSIEIDGIGISGSLVCDAVKYDGTKAGLGTSEITTEQYSLYAGDVNSPGGTGTGSSGVLYSFKVDGDCNVFVSANQIRDGVLMEDPDEDPVLMIVDGCTLFAKTYLDCPFWELGDINGDGNINASDVLPIIDYFGQSASAYPSADLDKDGWINANDVAPIINNLGAGDGVPCP